MDNRQLLKFRDRVSKIKYIGVTFVPGKVVRALLKRRIAGCWRCVVILEPHFHEKTAKSCWTITTRKGDGTSKMDFPQRRHLWNTAWKMFQWT